MLSKILEWVMGQKRIINFIIFVYETGEGEERGENDNYGHSTNVKVRGLCRQSL